MNTSQINQYLYDFASSVFFFVILKTIPTVYSGYIGHQFIQKMRDNDLYRNLFLIVTIWLICKFTEEAQLADEMRHSVIGKIILTFVIYFFILLFSRQTAIFNASELLLLFVMYVIHEVRNYYYSDYGADHLNRTAETLTYVTFGIWGLVIFLVILGYFNYMTLKMKQKGSRFKLSKFIFGKREAEYSKKEV